MAASPIDEIAGPAITGTMISPGLGTVIGAGIGLINGLIGYFGASDQLEQQKKAQKEQMALYREQLKISTEQANKTFEESKRQFEVQSAFGEKELAERSQLSNKTLALQEKQIDEAISQGKLALADSRAQKRISDRLDMISGISRLFSTPGYRAQFSQFYRR